MRKLTIIILLLCSLSSCSKKAESSGSTCPLAAYNTEDLPSGELIYQVSSSWQKQESTSSMRVEEYVIDPSSQTRLAVFFFPDMVNQLEDNLSRWKSQFAEDKRKLLEKKQFKLQGIIPVTIYHMVGTYLEKEDLMNPDSPVHQKPDFALIGVAVELENGTWFFKAVGPQAVIQAQRENIDDLVFSFEVKE